MLNTLNRSALTLFELLSSYKVDSSDPVSISSLFTLIFTQARDVTLFLTRVQNHERVNTALYRSGIIPNVVPQSNVFESLEEADWVMALSSIGSQTQEALAGARDELEGRSTRSIPVPARGYTIPRTGSYAGSVRSFGPRSVDSWA
jgi:hypothetical protein